MFPLNAAKAYPTEQWWIAGYSHEIGRDIVSLEILAKPVVLFRREDDQLVVLHGICPHRSFPLGKGRLVGDTLQCGYHGFRFDSTGACVGIPSQSSAPSTCRIKSYPVVERFGLIWIWMGSVEHADPARIPDLTGFGLNEAGWNVEMHAGFEVNARYTLLIDNLMDLSHITFVHEKTIPGGAATASARVEVVEGPGFLNAKRVVQNVPTNPLFRLYFPDQEGPFQMVIESLYLGPCVIKTGGPFLNAEGQELGAHHFVHCIVPIDEYRIRYFVVSTRNVAVGDPRVPEITAAMGNPGLEDVAVLEAVEAMLHKQGSDVVEVSCAADAAAVRVRRMLAAQIEGELSLRAPARDRVLGVA